MNYRFAFLKMLKNNKNLLSSSLDPSKLNIFTKKTGLVPIKFKTV